MEYLILLAVLLLIGIISTRITRLLKLPNVTGYLVIGLFAAVLCIILDEVGYDSPFYDDTLTVALDKMNGFISTIALGFIALSIGEEFKLSKLKEYGKKIMIVTLLQALLATILVDVSLIILCISLNLNISIAICLGAVATATAPAATLMVINQYKAKGPLVDILLPIVAFDDAIGLIVYAVSVSISKVVVTGNAVSFISIGLIPLINIFGSLIVGFVLGFIMHWMMKFFRSRNNHMIVIIAFTLLGVTLCEVINYVKIWGENLELSSLLCCMMIGAVYVNFANDDTRPIITRDIELMDRWTPFLFTLFFVLSGCHLATSAFNIFKTNSSFKELLPILLVFVFYIVMRSFGKYFGAFTGCKITKQSDTVTKYLGLTLLPQAGVAIGMANQISKIPEFQIDNVGNIIVTVVLCATLVYELVGPLITKLALNKAGEIPKEENTVLNS